ncbi:MAG: YARHG domain-containing protein [Mucilaginibacter sp.]|nr:YARHG domain-containing protein [Mucilaginibacter sp.]
MKTKPILITVAILVLLAGAFLFIRSRNLIKPKKDEINQFLYAFSNQINEGKTASLLADFDVNTPPRALKKLINLLVGKKDLNGKEKPLAAIHLNVDASTVSIVNSELIIAKIPAEFSRESFDAKSSVLTLKIHQLGPHQFKIIQVDAREFLADYFADENLIRSKIIADKDMYSPITLKAFETAKQLKSKYDSVIWFGHLNNKTYFYVVKGKWDIEDIQRGLGSYPYKMGLVSPDLKEIIPAEYDLVYNINGTFPGMVEVEKDNKKGFYDLVGKNIVPIKYDQIFPINDDENLAVLRDGDNYFYLKKDTSISERVDLKVSEFFSKIETIKGLNIKPDKFPSITEYNSREQHAALYIPPSYLVDLNMLNKIWGFQNPLRKDIDGEVHVDYKIDLAEKREEPENWFQAAFYSLKDHFIGGRGEFYDSKNLVIIDKKKNRVLSHEIRTDYGEEESDGEYVGSCNITQIKAINDSLFEVKAGALMYVDLYDSTTTITGGTYYHYLMVKNNKLIELPNKRTFGFTKYVKMDDSYLNGCYNLLIGAGRYNEGQKKNIDYLTPEILRYMKNEIYADYRYEFKDKRWKEVFQNIELVYDRNSGKVLDGNTTVDDSLTAIDKYNINWINQKLKGTQEKTMASR